MKVILCVLALSIFQMAFSEKLPSDFKRCSSKDTTCLKRAIEDSLQKIKGGLKELGVPSLDPLKISKLTIGAGQIINLVQNYEKIDMTGLSDSKLDDLNFDLDNGKISFSMFVPLLEFKGSYVVRGKILVLDVFGQGKCLIRLEKVNNKISMDVQKYDKNGETYLKVTKFAMETVPEHVHFQFDNLFDGNKQLGDNINNVLNDNWKEIYQELQVNYVEVVSRNLMRITNKLFEKIPLKYIFLD